MSRVRSTFSEYICMKERILQYDQLQNLLLLQITHCLTMMPDRISMILHSLHIFLLYILGQRIYKFFATIT